MNCAPIPISTHLASSWPEETSLSFSSYSFVFVSSKLIKRSIHDIVYICTHPHFQCYKHEHTNLAYIDISCLVGYLYKQFIITSHFLSQTSQTSQDVGQYTKIKAYSLKDCASCSLSIFVIYMTRIGANRGKSIDIKPGPDGCGTQAFKQTNINLCPRVYRERQESLRKLKAANEPLLWVRADFTSLIRCQFFSPTVRQFLSSREGKKGKDRS